MRKNVITIIILINICYSAFADKNDDLVQASGNGNLEKVNELIKDGTDVNRSGNYNDTFFGLTYPLIIAAANGHLEVVKVLLAAGADINQKQKLTPERTALHCSIQNGHLLIVKLLVNSGADIESKALFGETPLMTAASVGYIEIIKYLIKKGANVNAKASTKDSVLMMAVYNSGDIETVKILIQHGADINAVNWLGLTALRMARMKEKEDIIKLLEELGARE